jgi:hypothetical protein
VASQVTLTGTQEVLRRASTARASRKIELQQVRAILIMKFLKKFKIFKVFQTGAKKRLIGASFSSFRMKELRIIHKLWDDKRRDLRWVDKSLNLKPAVLYLPKISIM